MHGPRRLARQDLAPDLSAGVSLLLAILGLSLFAGIWAGQAIASVERQEDAEVQTSCLERAATWIDVHPTLLRAIAWVESRGNHHALNWNRNGSYDVGLMQINSHWYHRGLKPWWGALGQPCVNVAAATWILKQCMETYGYTWNAVGCYHAGDGWIQGPKRAIGQRYIRRVQQTIRRHTKAEQQKRALATDSRPDE